MNIPPVILINQIEFDVSDDISKIIEHKDAINFGYFIVAQKKFYLSWTSLEPVNVEFKVLENEKVLLVGIDLKVAALCFTTGKILLLLGLFSSFKYFSTAKELTFTINTELEDIVINKNGFSISQIISHDLEF